MQTTHEQQMLGLADAFFAAVCAGDTDALRAIYAPNAVIWHNYGGRTQDVEANLRVLAAATAAVRGFRYEDVRRTATASGFVQQHVLRGHAPDAAELHVPACVVCTVVDGRVAPLNEYFDSAHIAPLLARA